LELRPWRRLRHPGMRRGKLHHPRPRHVPVGAPTASHACVGLCRRGLGRRGLMLVLQRGCAGEWLHLWWWVGGELR